MGLHFLLVVGLLGGVAVDKAPTEADQKLAERWLLGRKEILDNLPGMIRRMDTGIPLEPVEKLKRILEDARAGDVRVPFLDSPLAVGYIGSIRGGRFAVLQRLGASSARAEIMDALPGSGSRRPRGGSVAVILRGIDTSGMVDGQTYSNKSCFKVAATTTYATAIGGSRTVFVLEPYDSSAAEKIYRKAVAQELAGAERQKKDRERAVRDAAEAKIAAKRKRIAHAEATKYPSLLKNARSLERAGIKDGAEKLYRRIIAEAPDSPEAAEAKKELQALAVSR